MPPVDQAFYEGVLRRIKQTIVIIGIGGVIILTAWKGWRYGGGFLIGAGGSYISFWRWQRVVDSVGTEIKRRAPWLLAIRFIVLIAAGFVIIEFTGVNQGAALGGLLLPGAAATIEILYQLIYGTRS